MNPLGLYPIRSPNTKLTREGDIEQNVFLRRKDITC